MKAVPDTKVGVCSGSIWARLIVVLRTAESPESLRVIRCLPVTWQCSALRGQASDKPRGRKPRAGMAQRSGALEVRVFERRGPSAATGGALPPAGIDGG